MLLLSEPSFSFKVWSKRTIRFKYNNVMMSLYLKQALLGLNPPHVKYCISVWNSRCIKDEEMTENSA